MRVLSSRLIRSQKLLRINWRLCRQIWAAPLHLDYMPPFNKHLLNGYHMPGRKNKPQSPVF